MYRTLALCCLAWALPTIVHAEETYDVVVYGGTSGGVAAALQATRAWGRAL